MANTSMERFDDKKTKKSKYYGDLLFNIITRGATDEYLDLDNVSIQMGFNRLTSKKFVAYYVQVSSFHVEISPNVLSDVRKTLKLLNTGNIYVDMICRYKPHKTKWKSTAMKNNVELWRTIRHNNKKKKEKHEEEGYADSTEEMSIDWGNRREASWKYFQECDKYGIATPLVAYIFRIRVPKSDRDINLKLLFDNIVETFSLYGMNVKFMNTYMYDIMNEISPFKHTTTKFASKLIADRVLSTEITTAFNSLAQGELNSGNIILGNDIKNRKGVHIDTHPKSGKGSNVTIISSTGGGKSVLAKSMGEQVLANLDYQYIIDYEGNEYTPYGDEYNATYLDFSGFDGKYYDPLRFATPTGIPDIDKDIAKNALNAIYMIIDILLKHPMTATQKKLLNMALVDYTNSHGFYMDKQHTWDKSLSLSLKGILPKLQNYNHSEKYKHFYGKDLTELADTLENYFNGPESYMFRNPISIDELREKRLLIVRFGGDTKEELVGEEPIDTQIKQLTVMLLIQELARYRRAHNDSFVILLEELQRYLCHKGSIPWVNSMYTGIRKCNGSMIGIINDPEKLQGNLSALVNSSEYVIVGANKDINALKYLFNTPALAGCENLVRDLDQIQHGFLIRDKGNMCSIFRVELPKSYLESPIYKTRTDKQCI